MVYSSRRCDFSSILVVSEHSGRDFCSGKVLWWIGGVALLLGGGWLGNIGLLGLGVFAKIHIFDIPFIPFGLDHHAHNFGTCYGYCIVALLWLALWWQCNNYEVYEDISWTCNRFKIVWLRGLYCNKHSKKLVAFSTSVLAIVVLGIGCGILTVLKK